MIEYKKGNILREDVEALVNTVNCVGIMGRGIALQFKNAFPENFKSYAAACDRHEVHTRLRDWSTHESEVHHQFSYQASLAGKEPN
jgi:O-acetyl-ADP-ribose deacetylase (regulator of RNase III)